MQDLQLISIWTTKRAQNSHINFHSHKYHELVYYPSGKGITEFGGNAFSFYDHCFTLIPRDTKHNEIHYANSEVICLEFFGAEDLPFGFYTDQSHTILQILKVLLNEVANQKFGYTDMLIIKLNELLLHIQRSRSNSATVKDFAFIINYIRENPHEHITLSDCAKQLNISYDYFQHKFKALTGCSPQQFLIEQRLLACKKMLVESNWNCTEIAYRCGFCTSAQFSALFKKKYAMTPMQFRRRYQKEH